MTLTEETEYRFAFSVEGCPACSTGLYATCGASSECFHLHEQALVYYPLEYERATSRKGYLVAPSAPDRIVDVDQGVLPLLRALWAAGVRTWVSCQGWVGEGRANQGYVSYHLDDHAAAVEVVTAFFPGADLDISESPEDRLPSGRIGFPGLA